MKKITFFLLFFALITHNIMAQDAPQVPVVMKAVYFDVSPPLRDMVQKYDAVIDQSWKDGIVKNRQNSFTNDTDQPIANYLDPVVQRNMGNMTVDTTIQNFDGVGAQGSLPPDTDGDVGPSHYFQVVNVKYAIYNKNGVKLLGPTNNSVIFNGLPNNSNDGDAIVLYDENADRWLFSQFSLPNYPNGPFYENVAISQTGDPTGSWYRYQFQFSFMPDYPKISVWGDGYYMTVRKFSAGSTTWIGPAVVAMERTKMIAGDPTAQMVMFNFPTSAEGTQAADCDSEFPAAGTPCPCAYLTSTQVKIYDFHVDWSNTANSTFVNNNTVPISMFSSFTGSNVIPQKNTSQKLDAMSGKRIMFRMPYRKFSTYSTMLLNTTANVSGVAGIRWMELRNSSGAWTLYQEGTYAPGDGHHRWMGSIAMDSAGNIALGYSISSSTMFPSIRYTGRLANDPLGQMTIAERGIINGGGSQSDASGRWGDYSAMVADPSEVGKFWYTTEYYSAPSSASWKTRIASFSFSNAFSTVASAAPALVCIGDSTQLYVSPNGGSGSYTYLWSSVPAGFNSTIQNPKAAPSQFTKYIVQTSDGLLTRIDTVNVNVQSRPVVNAGADTTVCWYVTSVGLHGSATNYKAIGWTTSGSGSFSNNSTLETTYMPTLADKLAGSVNVTLVAIANSPCTGNESHTKKITFDQCTGVAEDLSTSPSLSIQPNPASSSVNITLKGTGKGVAILTITSTDGKIVYSENIQGSGKILTKNLDVTGFAKGFYVVQLRAAEQTTSGKLVIQ